MAKKRRRTRSKREAPPKDGSAPSEIVTMPNTSRKDAAKLGKDDSAMVDATRGKVPHSIVVRHGPSTSHLAPLVADLRLIMEPNTATKLQERKNASIKDYVAIAGPMDVSHIMVVTQRSKTPNIRISRMPHGPTITFRVEQYTLRAQVRASLHKPPLDMNKYIHQSPLVILNNFEADILAEKRHLKIASLVFQSMFPAINVKTVKLGDCKRVLLLNLNEDNETIELRHYLIRTKPVGVNRSIKRIITTSKLPNLQSAEDISEILNARSGYATSDSEMEADAQVELPRVKRARKEPITAHQRSAVCLTEVGPRMTLRVIKVEDGVFGGEVQYHAFETRSQVEVEALRAKHNEKERLRKERKAKQEENVQRKRELEESKRELKLAKRKAREEAAARGETVEDDDDEEVDSEEDDEADDDAESVDGGVADDDNDEEDEEADDE